MKEKFYNNAIIGNKNIRASYSKTGELLRMYYSMFGYKKSIDFLHVGMKINNSKLIYLHDNVNNIYKQYYTPQTNILNTEIENIYFKVKILQIDFIPISKDVLIKKYTFKNNNFMDLDLKVLVNSKIVSNNENIAGSRMLENGLLQYNQNSNICIFSKNAIDKYQLNNVAETIKTGEINDKNYIGMSDDVAIEYNLGTIKSGETKEISIMVYLNWNSSNEPIHPEDIEKQIKELKNIEINKELSNTKRYWIKYVQKHDTIKIKEKDVKFASKLKQIYVRTILLFPLLENSNTGSIIEAVEVDEEKTKCEGYSFCRTNSALFEIKAMEILKMNKEAEKFYKIFCKNTQNADGMWEQRFYPNGGLAPCWGYQIDATSSVVVGTYEHYKNNKDNKDIRFLKDTLKMCEDAIKFLNKYIENLIGIKEESDIVKKEIEEKYKTNNHIYNKKTYDIWGVKQGIHIYSLSSVFAAYTAMININQLVEPLFSDNRVKVENLKKSTEKLEKYRREIKKYILTTMSEQETKSLRRNTRDKNMDISILGSVVPFEVFTPREKKILNTVEKINMTLRTYTGGYLRFEKDKYIGGKNPWTIATLWMGLYYKKLGNKEKVKECLQFIVNSATEHGFIAEQIENQKMQPKWVIGSSWAHALFIMLLEK